MPAVTIRSGFGAQKKKICHYFSFFLFYFQEVMGPQEELTIGTHL